MGDSTNNVNSESVDDEVGIRELWQILWAGKWLVGGITFAAALIGVIVALMLPNIYRAEAVLAPNSHEGSGGLSALAAQYGGLASLAGINVVGRSTDKTALGLEVLQSRKFISEFVERHDILVPLVAATGWDAASGKLVIDQDVYDDAAGKWVRDVLPPRGAIPSPQEAYERFREALSVVQDRRTGFVTISIEHYSPTVAKQWVDWLVSDLNSSVMLQDVKEAEQAISYLNRQVEKTSLADLQNVFFRLIEEQTKTVMLAKVKSEYLLKTLDPAVAPELKAKPKRSLIVIFSVLLGSFLALTVVLVSASLRHEESV